MLDSYQIAFLDRLNETSLVDNFYLSGGTALAEFYLQHRLSEDLDFFSETEFLTSDISSVLSTFKKDLGIKEIDIQTSFNRNLFFIHYIDGFIIKTEFTYYPFNRLGVQKKMKGMAIDSLLDIAVNKVFTIYQNPRTRDFIDLYMILQKDKNLKFKDLLKEARVKFDWHIDPIQLGTMLQKVMEIKDYPKMIEDIKDSEWQAFFIDESKKLGNSIFE